ncbi:type II secretion system minor pseudopilin GspI [Sphingomonas sp. JC676]|uniref:type II secretion system minor pseudopilin GspI n=1 Tax=Sphingomonas sp. JC676 TaxID=2768065 RepID=UPI00292A5070|nr:type II secretion system minor pseudopilin GspI [Sphingomonas sp. JC676]
MRLILAALLRKQEPRATSAPPATLDPCFRRGALVQSDESGFSLIEAMVALVVLAIATVGLMRTVESHIDSTRGLERRAAAMWVAENRLAELEIGPQSSAGELVEMMGQRWRVAVERRRTDDPEIERVRINVFAANETTPLASLDGFVDGRKG